jgi:hypothetical protein
MNSSFTIFFATTLLSVGSREPLVDAVADRLPSWKSRSLIKSTSTLSAIPVHVPIAVKVPPPWIYHAIELELLFGLWYGHNPRWRKVAELSGLGVVGAHRARSTAVAKNELAV